SRTPLDRSGRNLTGNHGMVTVGHEGPSTLCFQGGAREFFMGLRRTRAGMKVEYGDPAPVRSRSLSSVVRTSPLESLTAGHTVVPRIVASSTQSRISFYEYALAHRRRGVRP